MHKIHEKEFTLEDFSCEHLNRIGTSTLYDVIDTLNCARDIYLKGGNFYGEKFEPKDKEVWWQMIQLLPSSYNQRRTVKLNYEVLAGIYTWRKDHKLDEWRELCQWIESLQYSEIITARAEEKELLDTHTLDKIPMLLRDAGYLQASIAVENMKNNFQSITKIKESEG